MKDKERGSHPATRKDKMNVIVGIKNEDICDKKTNVVIISIKNYIILRITMPYRYFLRIPSRTSFVHT